MDLSSIRIFLPFSSSLFVPLLSFSRPFGSPKGTKLALFGRSSAQTTKYIVIPSAEEVKKKKEDWRKDGIILPKIPKSLKYCYFPPLFPLQSPISNSLSYPERIICPFPLLCRDEPNKGASAGALDTGSGTIWTPGRTSSKPFIGSIVPPAALVDGPWRSTTVLRLVGPNNFLKALAAPSSHCVNSWRTNSPSSPFSLFTEFLVFLCFVFYLRGI